MNKTLKKTLSIILAILMVVTTVPVALASEEATNDAVAVEFVESGFIKDGELQSDYRTSSSEGPENLFDGDPNSKFCVVISYSVNFNEFCDYCYITLKTKNKESAFISGYQFITGNDSPERDPVSWTLYGSDDNASWTVVDSREDAVITDERNAEVDFLLEENPEGYKYFRFEFKKLKEDQEIFQLSEITLLDHEHIKATESCGGHICEVCNNWFGEGYGSHESYVDGICTICGYKCTHSYADGICTICSGTCENLGHIFENGVCRGCGGTCKELGHSFENDVCTVCGATTGLCGENVTWILDTDGLLTISGSGDMYDDSHFTYNHDIKTVVVENGVRKIGNGAFWQCTNLTSITLPDSITTIGSGAFYGSALESITIPDSVTSIEDSAFGHCYSLNNIIIPGSIKSIGKETFMSCSSLKSITLPESVESIGDRAFYYCSDLENITFSSNVKSIGNSAFYACNWLDTVHYCGTSEQWRELVVTASSSELSNADVHYCTEKDKIPVSCGENGYEKGWYCADCSKYVIGGEVIEGTAHDFVDGACIICGGNCETLGHFFEDGICTVCGFECGHIFENGICTVCEYVCEHSFFEDGACTACKLTCNNLGHKFEDGMCTVCGGTCETLGHNFSLGTCTICGGTCETLGHSFSYGRCIACSYKCEHIFEGTVCTICGGTCETLGHNYKNGICTICSHECIHSWSYNECYVCGLNGGDLNSNIRWTLDKETGVLRLDGTGDMPEYSYYRDVPWFDSLRGDIKTVIVSEGITSLCESAFYMCSNLTSVTLPDTLNKIGRAAFCECSSLENIVIPSGVTTLDASAFAWCPSLKTIHYLGSENELTIDETNNELADGILHFCEEKSEVKPTCTEDGLTGGWYCDTCDEYVVGGEIIEANGHDFKDGTCTVCGTIFHTHDWDYTVSASGDRIIATCIAADCDLENGVGGTLTIYAPADLYADGTAKEAVIDDQLVEKVDYAVTYSTSDGEAPTAVGTYTASVTIGDATAAVSFTIITRVNINGTVTSFGSDTDDVVIELFADGEEEAVHSVTVNGNSTEYSFEDVETGTYRMVVSKNNHVAREYTLTVVDESLVQDAKIHLEGDVNGDSKVNTMDVARANAHARGVASVSDYEFDCLDVNGDGKINTVDVARVNAHARGGSSLR